MNIKPYKGKRSNYTKFLSMRGGAINHDGCHFSKKAWRKALATWSWAKPGLPIYNSFTDSMDVISEVEICVEQYYNTSIVLEFWAKCESGYILAEALKTKEEWLKFWGWTEENWEEAKEYADKWTQGLVP